MTEFQLAHPKLNTVIHSLRYWPVFREERDLSTLSFPRNPHPGFHHHINGTDPGRFLAIVDFSQVQQRPLARTSAPATTALNDAIIAMIFSIFAPFGFCQKHDPILAELKRQFKNQGLHYSPKRTKPEEPSMFLRLKRRNWSI
jgi:hypothetical protein